MSRVPWVAAVLLSLSGCTDSFTAPDQPDLYKEPHHYDLGDGVAVDQGAEQPPERDMAMVVHLDLRSEHD